MDSYNQTFEILNQQRQLLLDSSDEEESSTRNFSNLLPTMHIELKEIEKQVVTQTIPRWGGSKFGRAPNRRDHVMSHNMLIKRYFATDPLCNEKHFRRCYRMRKNVFLKLFNAVRENNDFFHQKYDALGVPGPFGLIKATAAVQLLSYGCLADSLDETIDIGEQTALDSLRAFLQSVVDVFEEEYLRTPTPADIQRLLVKGEERGFPGMLGFIDCIHWIWKNCPTAKHGQHIGGHHKKTIVILEVVADQELWIWQTFFGMAGSCNDLNILENSHVFYDILNGKSPPCQYEVNGIEYNMGYYLSDGIYPQWPTLIQTKRGLGTRKKKLFAKAQEAARKDVERAFDVLQPRFAMVARPTRTWKKA